VGGGTKEATRNDGEGESEHPAEEVEEMEEEGLAGGGEWPLGLSPLQQRGNMRDLSAEKQRLKEGADEQQKLEEAAQLALVSSYLSYPLTLASALQVSVRSVWCLAGDVRSEICLAGESWKWEVPCR
jgi:hypothetical protein